MPDGFDFPDSPEETTDLVSAASLEPPPGDAPDAGGDAVRSIEFLLDVPLDVSVEIGRNRMLIHELLQLGQGSVIELNKLAGEPLDVLINNRLVARGEAVVVNERFGVRLTEIVSPAERIERLKE